MLIQAHNEIMRLKSFKIRLSNIPYNNYIFFSLHRQWQRRSGPMAETFGGQRRKVSFFFEYRFHWFPKSELIRDSGFKYFLFTYTISVRTTVTATALACMDTPPSTSHLDSSDKHDKFYRNPQSKFENISHAAQCQFFRSQFMVLCSFNNPAYLVFVHKVTVTAYPHFQQTKHKYRTDPVREIKRASVGS